MKNLLNQAWKEARLKSGKFAEIRDRHLAQARAQFPGECQKRLFVDFQTAVYNGWNYDL